MKGYFTRLANQSSIAIGARNRSGRARSSSPAPEVAGAPPHVESVVLVDSYPAEPGTPSLNSSVERNKRAPAASEGVAATHADTRISREPQLAGRQVIASDNPRLSIDSFTDNSNKQTPQLSATSLSRPDSITPVERVSENEANAPTSFRSPLEREFGGEPGVVRVGELARSSDAEPGWETDPFTAVANKSNRAEPSIPRDYLEGLREWFGSPASISGTTDGQVEAERNPTSVSSDPERVGSPLRADVVYRDAPPQQDIQEFSLSIGSISIVVEEPAPQPKQQPSSAPPPARPQSGAPPRARDAFALSRNYFRGF